MAELSTSSNSSRLLVPAQQVLLKSQVLRKKLYSFDKKNTTAKVWKHWP